MCLQGGQSQVCQGQGMEMIEYETTADMEVV